MFLDILESTHGLPGCLLHARKECVSFLGSCQSAIGMQRLLMITMVSLRSILTEGHKTIYCNFLFGVPLYFIHVHFVIGKHLCAFRMSVFSSMRAEQGLLIWPNTRTTGKETSPVFKASVQAL